MRFPSLKPREFAKALKRAGFVEKHQTGSHRALKHPVGGMTVVVPVHNKDMRRGLLMALIKDAGFTPEEFRKFL